jgi:hypothetical protein
LLNRLGPTLMSVSINSDVKGYLIWVVGMGLPKIRLVENIT